MSCVGPPLTRKVKIAQCLFELSDESNQSQCIGFDQIDSLLSDVHPRTRMCWVMNTQNSNLRGDHWISILIDGRDDGSHSLEIYNPLGKLDREHLRAPILRNLRPIIQKLNPSRLLTFKENLIADQSMTSANWTLYHDTSS